MSNAAGQVDGALGLDALPGAAARRSGSPCRRSRCPRRAPPRRGAGGRGLHFSGRSWRASQQVGIVPDDGADHGQR